MAYGLTTEKSANNLDVGAGEFSIKNLDLNVNPYEIYTTLGNCSAATCTWNINKIQKYDATRGTRELIAEAETQRGAMLAVTMDESDPIKYALAMYGQTVIKQINDEDINQAFIVSPGDEIFVMTSDGSTAAYNYENLTVEYAVSLPASIGAPVLDTQGSILPPTGSAASSGAYTGTATEDFYIRITRANTVPGTITDTEFVWKKGIAGVYSTPSVAVTGAAQLIADGISVTFAAGASGQDFNVGDVFKIHTIAPTTFLTPLKDYSMDSVDIKNGKVRFPVDSAIGFKTQVIVRCHVSQQSIPRIYAGVNKTIDAEVRFEYDPTHGRQKSYTFYHVRITPNGDDGFISEDWGSRQIQAIRRAYITVWIIREM